MTKRDIEREQRLAAALRENLKRRKAQARQGLASRSVGKAEPNDVPPDGLTYSQIVPEMRRRGCPE